VGKKYEKGKRKMRKRKEKKKKGRIRLFFFPGRCQGHQFD
jgi:hypothetical protein